MLPAEGFQSRLRCAISGPAIFVGLVWIVMFASALYFLARFAVNVPFAEDGMLIPYVTGAEHLNAKFLFCEYNHHIIPLPKLALFLLGRFTNDFRTSMYFIVLICAIAALALTLAAKYMRGRLEYTDALFAISLLHLGHWECFLLGFCMQLVMSTGFLAVILFIIVRAGSYLTAMQSLLVGLCLVMLPATGMSGFLLAAPLAGWLAYSAWLSWRSGGPGAAYSAGLQAILVLTAITSMVLYTLALLHSMSSLQSHAERSEKGFAAFLVLIQLLASGFGASAATPWLPLLKGGWCCYLVGSVVLALAAIGLVLLFVRSQPPAERLRRVGLSLFLLANLLVLVGIILGRGVLCVRYSMLSVPLLWGIYFTWQLYGARLGGRLIPVGLFAFMCVMSSINMQQGCSSGEQRYTVLKSVERDIKAEIPVARIVTSHRQAVVGDLWVYYKARLGGRATEQANCDEMATMVNLLRKAGIPRRAKLHPQTQTSAATVP
jgi:hypothetical protein